MPIKSSFLIFQEVTETFQTGNIVEETEGYDSATTDKHVSGTSKIQGYSGIGGRLIPQEVDLDENVRSEQAKADGKSSVRQTFF